MDIYDILAELARGQGKPYLMQQISRLSASQHFKQEQEKEQLIKEILSRISVSVDAKDAIMQINALNKAIKSLGK